MYVNVYSLSSYRSYLNHLVFQLSNILRISFEQHFTFVLYFPPNVSLCETIIPWQTHPSLIKLFHKLNISFWCSPKVHMQKWIQFRGQTQWNEEMGNQSQMTTNQNEPNGLLKWKWEITKIQTLSPVECHLSIKPIVKRSEYFLQWFIVCDFRYKCELRISLSNKRWDFFFKTNGNDSRFEPKIWYRICTISECIVFHLMHICRYYNVQCSMHNSELKVFIWVWWRKDKQNVINCCRAYTLIAVPSMIVSPKLSSYGPLKPSTNDTQWIH